MLLFWPKNGVLKENNFSDIFCQSTLWLIRFIWCFTVFYWRFLIYHQLKISPSNFITEHYDTTCSVIFLSIEWEIFTDVNHVCRCRVRGSPHNHVNFRNVLFLLWEMLKLVCFDNGTFDLLSKRFNYSIHFNKLYSLTLRTVLANIFCS
jgi:hypothetical protein